MGESSKQGVAYLALGCINCQKRLEFHSSSSSNLCGDVLIGHSGDTAVKVGFTSVVILAVAIAVAAVMTMRPGSDLRQAKSAADSLERKQPVSTISASDNTALILKEESKSLKDQLMEQPEKTGKPVYDWPDNIENDIWEYFSHQTGLKLVSITSVECDERQCEIAFSTNDLNPQYVDEVSPLAHAMYEQPWNVQTSAVGTREISPGVREFVISISNVPFEGR